MSIITEFFLRRYYFPWIRIWKPIISSDEDSFSIANPPRSSLTSYTSCFQNALLGIRAICLYLPIQNGAIWEVVGFENLVKEEVSVVDEPPNLNCSKSLIPKPPCVFGKHNFFHLIQWILRALSLYPHQNFWIKDSMSLQRHFGSLKQFIVKVGMAWITALIKISLPAWNDNFSFHSWFFSHIRSRI